MNAKEYAAAGGTECPNCGSSDINTEVPCTYAGETTALVTCTACGASWLNVYKLVGFTELRVSSKEQKNE